MWQKSGLFFLNWAIAEMVKNCSITDWLVGWFRLMFYKISLYEGTKLRTLLIELNRPENACSM